MEFLVIIFRMLCLFLMYYIGFKHGFKEGYKVHNNNLDDEVIDD